MDSDTWYLVPNLELPKLFEDRRALKRVLPYGKRWLFLESGGVYRGELEDEPPLYATGYTSFSASYLVGHFGVVPNPILLMAAGQTALLLSAVLSIDKSGCRYAAVFTRFHDIRMELENVHASETVATRAWLTGKPTFEGSSKKPEVIRGSILATVDVIRHSGGRASTVRILTANGGLDFVARPRLGVFKSEVTK